MSKVNIKSGGLALALALALSTLIASMLSVWAQSKPVAGTADKLNPAIALLNQGKPSEAREVIAKIDKTDASYGAAKCYDALCLYQLDDKRKFLKAVESPDVQSAKVAPALREDLEFKQIDALFYYRRFDELLTNAQSFQKGHGHSARLPTVAEYQLATLFEHGMKKSYESCLLTSTNGADQHWNDGRGNLQNFLSLAASFSRTNYQVLTNRTLKEEIWLARLTLGQEAAVLKEIPAENSADRERVGLLGIKLYRQLQPKAADDNLRRMKNFITDFPDSQSRKRVEFDMADISFSKGEALSRAADAAEARQSAGAAAMRDQAHVYFNYTLTLRDKLVTDAAAGIEDADVFDRQDDLLHSYYLEKNCNQMRVCASTLIQGAAPGSLTWMMGKIYRGIAWEAQTPSDLKQAAAEFDDVLALNFNGRADHDHQILVAAKWRIYLARKDGDDAKAAQIAEWVKASNCTKNQKTAFLKYYADSLAAQATHAK